MPGRTPTTTSPRARRIAPALALTVALTLCAGACSRGEALANGEDDPPSTSVTPPPSTTSTTSTTTTSTTTTTTSTTSTTTTTTSTTSTTTTTAGPPPIPIADIRLQKGDEGDAVRVLEQQLVAAGYWLDRSDDGVFDEDTRHAVVALQKTNGLERTGVFDAFALAALSQPARPAPRSAAGPVIEVDLTRQVLFVVRDGVVAEVFDVSTGRKPGWTPAGEYAVTREIDGVRHAPLGRLYRPKYFVGGVAVHGYSKVPPEPQSHGCVRVTNSVMDHIWASDLMPKGTPVWVYA